jgi:hypothetical protein
VKGKVPINVPIPSDWQFKHLQKKDGENYCPDFLFYWNLIPYCQDKSPRFVKVAGEGPTPDA